MTTIFHEGHKILRDQINNHNFALIADFLFFRVSGSKYINKHGKQFFLLPNVDHISENTGFKETMVKNALSYLRRNEWISTDRIRCFDGAVRTRIFLSEKFKNLMLQIELLKHCNNKAVNDEPDNTLKDIDSHNDSSKLDKSKGNVNPANKFENNLNLDSVECNYSDSSESDESYIIEQTKKENNNNVNNIKSKSNKNISYQNNVSSISFDLDFLKVFESDEYSKQCKNIIDQIAKDNNVCDSALAITILDLADLRIYQSTKLLVDDAITLTKRIITKEKNKFPTGDNKSLGKILKASESQRMSQLTPIQILGVTKMLDYLESKKNVRLTNKQEVFSWIEYQLTNPEFHLKNLTFRHALNVIAKTLQTRGAQGYSKPFGFKMVSSF